MDSGPKPNASTTPERHPLFCQRLVNQATRRQPDTTLTRFMFSQKLLVAMSGRQAKQGRNTLLLTQFIEDLFNRIEIKQYFFIVPHRALEMSGLLYVFRTFLLLSC